MSGDAVFLESEDVFEIHSKNINRTGGGDGLRGQEGEGLLSSALAQPQAQFGGEYLHPTLWSQAAAYAFHIAQNQPFLDGNKRTALSAAALFLRLNGHRLRDDGVQLHRMMLDIAERKIDKDGVARLLEALSEPADL